MKMTDHSCPAPTLAPMPLDDDASPDLSVTLEAGECAWDLGPHGTVAGWGFDGRIPGPTLEARVGQVLSVRLANRLAEPTTIHWHGVRLPAAMDGTESTQVPVGPGETFEYRFRLLDAGTFWYHPHANETVQLEHGLYGALVVRGEDEPVFDAERVLLLDDVKLDRRGRIARPGGLLQRHNGREGAVRVLNGEVDPELRLHAGQVERWRIANVASARYVRLALGAGNSGSSGPMAG